MDTIQSKIRLIRLVDQTRGTMSMKVTSEKASWKEKKTKEEYKAKKR